MALRLAPMARGRGKPAHRVAAVAVHTHSRATQRYGREGTARARRVTRLQMACGHALASHHMQIEVRSLSLDSELKAWLASHFETRSLIHLLLVGHAAGYRSMGKDLSIKTSMHMHVR